MTVETLIQTATDTAASLVEELVAALINTRIYAREHPRVQGSISAVQRHLLELNEHVDDDAIRLVLADNLLIFKQRPLVGASLSASRLINAIEQWGSGGIEMKPEATREEINELFVTLLAQPGEGQSFDAANERLIQVDCKSLRLLPPYSEDSGLGFAQSRRAICVPVKFYQAVIDLLQNITVNVCHGGKIQFEPVQTQAEEVLKRLESEEGPMMNLARQDQYDAFTFGHSVRVSVLSLNFGRAMTKDRELLIRLGTAALLHDVGKSLIPFEILHSRTTLTAEERREMGKHPELGAELLLDHHESDPLAIVSAFGHHKAEGGRGYPRTAHTHENSIVTEIIKICDVYEALTAARPYKRPMTPIRAYRVMMSMKGQFEPKLMRRFIEVNGIYPTGQLVELDTGEMARIHHQTRRLLEPGVQIISDREGNSLEEQNFEVRDLSKQRDDQKKKIVAAVEESTAHPA